MSGRRSAAGVVSGPGRGLQLWAVMAVCIVTRFWLIEEIPAEWYGDISTVHEMASSLRRGVMPPGLAMLGVGPVFPAVVVPFQELLGVDYLSMKLAAACCSLVGLWALFHLARDLVDESFAVVATVVAATGSWWLVFSRLGDVQALTPTVTVVALLGVVRAVQRGGVAWPAVAGLASAAGAYLYGNTLVLPLVTGVAVAAAWGTGRLGRRAVASWGAATAAVLAPLVALVVLHPEHFSAGHVGSRVEVGTGLPQRLWSAGASAVSAYVTTGDANPRANPGGDPHIDVVSLVLAAGGVLWWCAAPRRRSGYLLLSALVLLHLPALLASDSSGATASRTTAAAPVVYLLVAGGLRGGAERVRRLAAEHPVPHAVQRLARPAVLTWSVVALVAGVNLQRYFDTYVDGLPVGNLAPARAVVAQVRSLPDDVAVLLVAPGWTGYGPPEAKSVAYQVDRGERVGVVEADRFDCGDVVALAGSVRATLVVWSPDVGLPGSVDGDCADRLGAGSLHVDRRGRPTHRSVVLGGGAGPGPDAPARTRPPGA